MTTRIGTYGATQGYINELMAIQSRVQNEQSQVSTGLKSTTYAGIASDVADVLDLNNQLSTSQQFVQDNNVASTKLTAASDAISSMQTTIENFRNQMNTFMSGNTKDPASIATLQNMAFQSLQSMQGYLGTNIGGDYIFSGGRVTTNPVDFPATSLDQFQSLYNGTSTTYPVSRTTDLASFDLTAQNTGPLTFNPNAGTVTAATSEAFQNVPIGSTVTLGGLVPPTQVTVTGISNSGKTITVAQPSMVAETETAATLSFGGNVISSTSNTGGATCGNLTVTPTGTGTFTITPSTVGSLSALTTGKVFTLSGTTNNNGSYMVEANNGNSLTISNVNLGLAVPTTGDQSTTLTDGTTAVTDTQTNGGAGGYGSLTFGANDSGEITIAASTPNAFANGTIYAAGATITVTGSSPNGANDGQYTVLSNDGTTLAVARRPAMPVSTPAMSDAAATIDDTTSATTITTGLNNGVAGGYGTLTFTNSGGTLQASASGALTGVSPGDTITISGSVPNNANNGTYIVTALAGTTMTLASQSVTLGGSAAVTSAAGGGGGYGALTFGSNANGQMTLNATNANAFNGVYAAGSTITITGSVPNSVNDGTYIVAANSNNQLTLTTTPTSFTTGIQPTTTEQAATLTDTTNGTALTSTLTNAAAGGYGTLSIATNTAGQMTITAATANALSGFSAGDTIQLTNAGANNGKYYVESASGDTLTLATTPPSISASSWYKGDTLNIEQPINSSTNLGIGIYASDPAFEKAIRAMGMIAQGAANTPGGLAANQDRIAAASYLLSASITNPGIGTPPSPLSGTEEVSNLTSLGSMVGFNLANINNQVNSETQLQGFIQTRLGTIENEDPTTAITNLLADNQSLQASYQSLSQIFNLSILNYLK